MLPKEENANTVTQEDSSYNLRHPILVLWDSKTKKWIAKKKSQKTVNQVVCKMKGEGGIYRHLELPRGQKKEKEGK